MSRRRGFGDGSSGARFSPSCRCMISPSSSRSALALAPARRASNLISASTARFTCAGSRRDSLIVYRRISRQFEGFYSNTEAGGVNASAGWLRRRVRRSVRTRSRSLAGGQRRSRCAWAWSSKRGSPVPRSLARCRYLFEQLGSSFCPSCWDHGTARSLRFRATPPLALYCLNPGAPNDSVAGVSAITTSSESLPFPVHAARAERTCPRSRAAPTLLRASLCATC